MNRQQLYDLFGYYEEERSYHISKSIAYYVCAHPRPFDISVQSDETMTMYRALSNIKNTYVEINKHTLPDGDVVYAGKCRVCGKVYYS